MFKHHVIRALQRLKFPVLDLSEDRSVSSKWHQDFIVHLAGIFQPELYVELGIHHCGLFNRIVPHATKLIGVDLNPESQGYMVRSEKVEFVHAGTAEFCRQLNERPVLIDMLFIDADHSAAAVERDFTSCFPFVASHGLILLHDTHPLDERATDQERCGDAYKTIEKLSVVSDEFEMMTLPKHPGLTLCRKRKRQLAWQESAPGRPGTPGV